MTKSDLDGKRAVERAGEPILRLESVDLTRDHEQSAIWKLFHQAWR